MKSLYEKISADKVYLILNHVFWGVCASRLEVIEDETCDTAYTDAKVIGYNPKFMGNLPDIERLFVIAHEVVHVVLGHCFRCAGKNLEIWQMACDYAANLILVDIGFQMPEGGLLDRKYQNMSADEIYYLLMRDRDALPDHQQMSKSGSDRSEANAESFKSSDKAAGSQNDNRSIQGDCDKSDDILSEKTGIDVLQQGDESRSDDSANPKYRTFGEVRPNADPKAELDWKNNVKLAGQQAIKHGSLSGTLRRIIQEVCSPEVDFKALAYIFVQNITPSDYSWSRPNTSYLSMGLYVPSLYEKRLGKLYFVNDTSGSITDYQQSVCQALLRDLASDLKPELLTVIHCDAKVTKIEEFEEFDKIVIDPVGGGGTDFTPGFLKIQEMDEAPAGAIILTDLEGKFPKDVPDYPVLWICTQRGKVAPFGETIYLDLRSV